MKPGVNIDQARADMSGVAAREAQQYPEAQAKVGAWLIPLHEQISGPSEAALFAMTGAVALVLLIACVNIANLLLVRGATRARELSVRAALGAGSARILRQLVTENAVLAMVGGALGLTLGVYGSRALAVLVPDSIRQVQDIRADGVVLAFAVAVTMLAGAMFGLLPAFRAARSNSHQWLRGGTREIGARSGALRGGLVVAQLSLAVVLLVGAGLLLRSFLLMERVDLGYRTNGVLLMNVAFPVTRYPDAGKVTAVVNTLLERTRVNPAIKSAEISDIIPLTGGGDQDISAFPVGEPSTDLPPSMWYRAVTAGYLGTMHMRLVHGRMFTDADRAGSAQVAIINEEAARAFWHGKDPVGRQFSPSSGPDAPDARKITVIGVVANARHDGANQPYKPEVFAPLEQFPTRRMVLVVEPSRDAASATAAVRDALKATDPLVPMPAARDIETLVGDAVSLPRLYATLVSIFASAALLLAVLGVYGVMAYSVSQRQREIGVRLALGAAPASIMAMVLSEGGRLVAIGVVIGLGAALALGRGLRSLLFGVTAFDIPTFAVVAGVLGLMTMIAAWVPARRAMRVDPLAAIREE
jgi:putative ABC transport system permease protein